MSVLLDLWIFKSDFLSGWSTFLLKDSIYPLAFKSTLDLTLSLNGD